MMKITQEMNGETMIVSISGRLDTTTAPELETFLNDNLSATSKLIFDCKDFEYISSAGLRVLLSAQKKLKGAMKLINVGELIMEVFEMTGFSDILTIE